ncbi:MAG: penicillin acylase family protein [Flavobacteriaceae bacterium]
MKYIRRILRILLVIFVVFGVVGYFIVQSLKPDYAGEIDFPGIEEEVKVYYDEYGIPHIFSNSEEDAVRILGYVHAQDRLWQMELLRRIAKGQLSEVFGRDLVSTDKFFLSLGIDDATQKTVSQLEPDARSVIMARNYLAGINRFIETGPTPVEFYLTGVDKSPFTLEDIHNVIGYMAFSFAMGLKTDPLLTDIYNSLGNEYTLDLGISVDPNTEWIRNYNPKEDKETLVAMVSTVNEALEKLPVPSFIGSNSWVLAPAKTKDGKVILANDPHIGFAQPSVWYEAHVVSPDYEKYGYHIAGIPFPLLAHDRNLAYGITMFENDDLNFYHEELHPNDSTRYLTEDGYETFEVVNREIVVKDSAEVSFSYNKSKNGPILNDIADQIKGDTPVSVHWIYTQYENKLLEALYRMSHGRNIEEFSASLPDIHAPGLNIMYGDAKGNIAWWATAKLYDIPDSLNTKLIMDGRSNSTKLVNYLDFEHNPQAVNPPWNYVYSANNQPDSIAGMLYPGYYLPENRARRIVKLLEAKDNWNKEEVADMVTDVVSAVNPEITRVLLMNVDKEPLNETEAAILDMLFQWDGSYEVVQLEPTIYHRWIYYILKNTLEDELGQERFSQLLSTHLIKRLIAPMISNKESIWWDDVQTEDQKETQIDIINRSLRLAFDSLYEDLGPDTDEWKWGAIHILEHKHPIGEVPSLRSFFNSGPFPIDGTREVINNMAFKYDTTSTFQVYSGPSTRRVIDFSDIENGWSILPTGQSGNPFSDHYEDQAKMYNRGEYRKMMMNKEEIMNSSKSLLIFRPL